MEIEDKHQRPRRLHQQLHLFMHHKLLNEFVVSRLYFSSSFIHRAIKLFNPEYFRLVLSASDHCRRACW